MRKALTELPADHPLKLVHETWPCGDHAVRGVTYANAPRTLRACLAAAFDRAAPSLPCLRFNDETRSFGETRAEVAALGAALVHDFGIGAGDRVALSMRNYPEWCTTFLAVTSLGAIIVPLNSLWKGAEMTYGLRDSGAKVLVCDAERMKYAAEALATLRIPAIVAHIARGAALTGAGSRHYHDVVASRRGQPLPAHPAEVGTDDTAAIFYTSGSTGDPKGVCQTHRNLCNQLHSGWALRQMTAPPPAPDEPQEVRHAPNPNPNPNPSPNPGAPRRLPTVRPP